MPERTASRKIIDALGGAREVAGFFEIERNVVSQWYRIGIPARYWPEMIRQAIHRGQKWITLDVLETNLGSIEAAALEAAQDTAA